MRSPTYSHGHRGDDDQDRAAAAGAQKKKPCSTSSSRDINRLRPMVPRAQFPKIDAQLDRSATRARIRRRRRGPRSVKQICSCPSRMGHDGANADEASHQTVIRTMREISAARSSPN